MMVGLCAQIGHNRRTCHHTGGKEAVWKKEGRGGKRGRQEGIEMQAECSESGSPTRRFRV
jgi:hypothetical protein